ncbi:hypothetical protein BOX15_Mlig007014g1 [Macrostomum lignano]|uniref:Cytochrome b-c1 complex subunit 7 n=1 Tax=Macrostomum lignano TaxID=282301 RepID=A0A267F0X8_9PLAT|nr:hypothetical protein BOX15_Mlig007014g1 [Macrostomum lignano]
MASKTAKSVAKYVGSYARAMVQRHEELMQRRLQDESVKIRADKLMMTSAQHRKVGLVDDDQLYDTYRDHVHEAIQRLPREEQEGRVFRHVQAAYLSARHEILPKEEQITEANNRPYAILYVNDALDEMHAKLYWEHQ